MKENTSQDVPIPPVQMRSNQGYLQQQQAVNQTSMVSTPMIPRAYMPYASPYMPYVPA